MDTAFELQSIVLEGLDELNNTAMSHSNTTNDIDYIMEHLGDENLTKYQSEKLETKLKQHDLSNATNVPVTEGFIGGAAKLVWGIIKGLVKVILTPFVLIFKMFKFIYHWLFGGKSQINKEADALDAKYKDIQNRLNELQKDRMKKVNANSDNTQPLSVNKNEINAVPNKAAKQEETFNKVESVVSKIKPKSKFDDINQQSKVEHSIDWNNISEDPEFQKFYKSKENPFGEGRELATEAILKQLEELPINLNHDRIAGIALSMPETGQELATDLAIMKYNSYAKSCNNIAEDVMSYLGFYTRRCQEALRYINTISNSQDALEKVDTHEIIMEYMKFKAGLPYGKITKHGKNLGNGGKSPSKLFDSIGNNFASYDIIATHPSFITPSKAFEDIQKNSVKYLCFNYTHSPNMLSAGESPEKLNAILDKLTNTFKNDKRLHDNHTVIKDFVRELHSNSSPEFTVKLNTMPRSDAYAGKFPIRAKLIGKLNDNGNGKNDENSIRKFVDIVTSDKSGINQAMFESLEKELKVAEINTKKVYDDIKITDLNNGNLANNAIALLNYTRTVQDYVTTIIEIYVKLMKIANQCKNFLEHAMNLNDIFQSKFKEVRTSYDAAILWYELSK